MLLLAHGLPGEWLSTGFIFLDTPPVSGRVVDVVVVYGMKTGGTYRRLYQLRGVVDNKVSIYCLRETNEVVSQMVSGIVSQMAPRVVFVSEHVKDIC